MRSPLRRKCSSAHELPSTAAAAAAAAVAAMILPLVLVSTAVQDGSPFVAAFVPMSPISRTSGSIPKPLSSPVSPLAANTDPARIYSSSSLDESFELESLTMPRRKQKRVSQRRKKSPSSALVSEMDAELLLSSSLSSSSSSSSLPPQSSPTQSQSLSPKRRMTKAKSASSNSRVRSTTTVLGMRSGDSLARSALLTRDEEYEATYQLRELRAAVRTRDDLTATTGREPTEEEWAAACQMTVQDLRHVMKDGQEARFVLVSANAGLVNMVAKKCHEALKRHTKGARTVGTILTFNDLVQEGNLGLMEAAERFEPERGFRFSTYATWWVKQRINQCISDSSRVIRLPAHVHWMINKINRSRHELEQQIGRAPTPQELAKFLDISLEKLELYSDSSRGVLSLEVPFRNGSHKEEDTRTLGEFISSDSPTPEEDAEIESLRQDIRDVMNDLGGRERDVLVSRFGLEDGSPRTVDETSKRLGISRDRVRVIEARALNKLRNPQRNYKLKEYVGNDETGQQQVEEANMSPERIWSI